MRHLRSGKKRIISRSGVRAYVNRKIFRERIFYRHSHGDINVLVDIIFGYSTLGLSTDKQIGF